GAVPPARPVKPGDTIMLFGTGFGPTDPPVPDGEIVRQVGRLITPVSIRIGGVLADVGFAGIVGAGLYQFNVTIPSLIDGDQQVVAEIDGFRTPASAFITVQRQ